MTDKQLAQCRQWLQTFTDELLAPLGRSESRHWVGVYLRGLLLDSERNSVGAMAARLPDGNKQNLQQFLSQSLGAWEPLWQTLAYQGRVPSRHRSPG